MRELERVRAGRWEQLIISQGGLSSFQPRLKMNSTPLFFFNLHLFSQYHEKACRVLKKAVVQMAKANNADTNHFLPSSPHHLNFERFRNLVNRAFYTRLQKTLRSTINLVL